MAALIAAVLMALVLSLGFAFAAPWLVLVPIALVIMFVAWLVALAVAHMSPGDAVRKADTRKPDLLGPGGPDDPSA